MHLATVVRLVIVPTYITILTVIIILIPINAESAHQAAKQPIGNKDQPTFLGGRCTLLTPRMENAAIAMPLILRVLSAVICLQQIVLVTIVTIGGTITIVEVILSVPNAKVIFLADIRFIMKVATGIRKVVVRLLNTVTNAHRIWMRLV